MPLPQAGLRNHHPSLAPHWSRRAGMTQVRASSGNGMKLIPWSQNGLDRSPIPSAPPPPTRTSTWGRPVLWCVSAKTPDKHGTCEVISPSLPFSSLKNSHDQACRAWRPLHITGTLSGCVDKILDGWVNSSLEEAFSLPRRSQSHHPFPNGL